MTELEVLESIESHLSDIKALLFVSLSILVGYIFYRVVAQRKFF